MGGSGYPARRVYIAVAFGIPVAGGVGGSTASGLDPALAPRAVGHGPPREGSLRGAGGPGAGRRRRRSQEGGVDWVGRGRAHRIGGARASWRRWSTCEGEGEPLVAVCRWPAVRTGGHFREMSGTVEGPRRPDYVGVRPPPAGRRRRDRGRTRARSTPAGILR